MTPNGQNGNGNAIRDPISPSHNDSTDYKYGELSYILSLSFKQFEYCFSLPLNFAGRFDASALHIAHALKQTEIQKSYNKAREKPIDEYLVSFLLFN